MKKPHKYAMYFPLKPPPFNPEFREGFGEAVHEVHVLWCEKHPNATKEERAKAYVETSERLRNKFPSVAEKQSKNNIPENLGGQK